MAQPEPISTTELSQRWNSVSEPGFGWVFYRNPAASNINFIAGKVSESSVEKISGDNFVIAPFYDPKNNLWHIKNSLHFQLNDNDLKEGNINIPFYHIEGKTEKGSTRPEYEKLVSDILAKIEKGDLQKTVPARTKPVQLKPGFSPFRFYESLLGAYPNAFVYMLSTPQTGTWIGCTPEKLLQVRQNEINTMSLAGTIKTIGMLHEVFTPKEIEEQAIVTRYIENIFKNYCSEIKMDGPESIKAGNVSHLATIIKGLLKHQYHNNYMQILNKLHPTPAVCGMPMQASRDFLLQNQNFDRSLYSGFLGPVSESFADLFVNLRCMQVFDNSALLYAGAGVVAGSIPENEWLETEEKMNTLLRFL